MAEIPSTGVLIWWIALSTLAVVNLALWILIFLKWRRTQRSVGAADRSPPWQLILSGGYVAGCAFRSIVPRVDVQRLCLYDSWLSSIFLGRTVATVAELCFVAQWALLLRTLARDITETQLTKIISTLLIPMIVIAEICSWSAVITKNFLGHFMEESLWALSALLFLLAALQLFAKVRGERKRPLLVIMVVAVGYIAFMVTIDVPMYYHLWMRNLSMELATLPFWEGVQDALHTRVISQSWDNWCGEMPWMTLYFSLAVWASLSMVQIGEPKVLIGRKNS